MIVGDKGKANIRLTCTKDTELLTNKVQINIKGRLLNIGIKELILPDGTTKQYSGTTINIEENYDITKNGTYTFTLIGNDDQRVEQEITIDNILEEKIEISVSRNDEGTLQAEVIWPDKVESMTKEISLDNGTTWEEYIGIVTLQEDATIIARVSNEGKVIKEQILIAYTTPGTYTFTSEVAIEELKIIVAGAGGGSASGTYGTPRSRGGYGGYYEDTISIEAATEYSVVVGSGGYRGYYYGSCNSGKAGGSSAFGSYTAAGGGGATTSNVSGADGATNVEGVYGGKGYSSGDYGAYGDNGWVYVSYEKSI